MRCAIYFIPPEDDALTVAAARWLRRDVYSGAGIASEVEGLIGEHHAFLTAAVRRYGFHATLKAPFRLLDHRRLDELCQRVDDFARSSAPVVVPVTEIGLIDSYFALRAVRPVAALDELAARVVTQFDGFRSPLTDAELYSRNPGQLNARQLSNLMMWGHPHCFDQFRFHMALTGPVEPIERQHVAQVLARFFGPLAAAPVVVDQLAIFVEPEANAPMVVHSVHRLRQASVRQFG